VNDPQQQVDKRSVSWFKPGQSGNPGGKPKGTRNKIQADFLKELSEDFEVHGRDAIEKMRATDPSGYVRTVAALLPKEVEVHSSLDELSDDQLSAIITACRAILIAQGAGEGIPEAEELQPA